MANVCSSCSDSSIPGTDDNNAVQFSATISSDNDWNPLSRYTGDETDMVSFSKGQKIGVFGFYLPNGTTTIGEPNFMYNQEMSFNGTDWEYSPIKYWPNNQGDKLAFWAYYPFNASGVKVGVNLDNGKPKFVFYDEFIGEDFLVSDIVEESKIGVAEKVPLLFRHIKGKLKLQVKVNPYIDIPAPIIKVSHASVGNIPLYGIFHGFDENGVAIWTDVVHNKRDENGNIIYEQNDKGEWVDISGMRGYDDSEYTLTPGETLVLHNFTGYYMPYLIEDIYFDLYVKSEDENNMSGHYRQEKDDEGNFTGNYVGKTVHIFPEEFEGIQLKAGEELFITVTIGAYGIDNVESSSRPIAEWRETTKTPVTF